MTDLRTYQATIHETALGSVRRSDGAAGSSVFLVGPQECTHHLTSGEARDAAAALLAVASEIDPPAPFDLSQMSQIGGLYGDIIKDGCKHVMTGGCPFECFRGPCSFEVAADA